ncbi:MAG: fimbrillin family protein [Rikenellaceae bacterium]
MKKLLTFFALLLLAQSCTKETDVSLGGDTSSVAVSFTASVVSTKATLINSWSGGEEVALFVDGDSKAYHFTVAADGTMSGDEVVIDREENITYTAFYPYDDSLTTAVEYEAACEAGNVDYMSATTETSGKDVALPFTHLMSALSFKIVIEGETTTPAISLAVDGDFGSAVALDVETTRGTLFSQLVANYFVEAGTDISSAMINPTFPF